MVSQRGKVYCSTGSALVKGEGAPARVGEGGILFWGGVMKEASTGIT